MDSSESFDTADILRPRSRLLLPIHHTPMREDVDDDRRGSIEASLSTIESKVRWSEQRHVEGFKQEVYFGGSYTEKKAPSYTKATYTSPQATTKRSCPGMH